MVLQRPNRQLLTLVGLIVLLPILDYSFTHSDGWWRVFWSLVGYLALYFTCRLGKLGLNDTGLSPSNAGSGLRYGAFVAGLILLFFALAAIIDISAFQDRRYNHGLSTAFYSALVLLPIKTVFFEELVFRGIILGLVLKIKASKWTAVIVSSLLYGLWHLSTATGVKGDKALGGLGNNSIIISIGVVLATTFAGMLFCELRLRSKSLVAPVLAHWFINGTAIVLAALSWR
jgi:membrane protease YdiL (CAAX protease family)